MAIRVRALRTCYHNHGRHKEGKIFEIRNMKAFAEDSMELVDANAEHEVDVPSGERVATALSEGSKNIHQGKVIQPKDAGAAADKVADARETQRRACLSDEERIAEDKEVEEALKKQTASTTSKENETTAPKANETDGNEDVI